MVSVALNPGTFPQRGEAERPFGDASRGVVSDEVPEIADVVVSLRRNPRVHDGLWRKPLNRPIHQVYDKGGGGITTRDVCRDPSSPNRGIHLVHELGCKPVQHFGFVVAVNVAVFGMAGPAVVKSRDVKRLARIPDVVGHGARQRDVVTRVAEHNRADHQVVHLLHAEGKRTTMLVARRSLKAVVELRPCLRRPARGSGLPQLHECRTCPVRPAWLVHVGKMIRFVLAPRRAPDQIGDVGQSDKMRRAPGRQVAAGNGLIAHGDRFEVGVQKSVQVGVGRKPAGRGRNLVVTDLSPIEAVSELPIADELDV
jgi:hypothetical protein